MRLRVIQGFFMSIFMASFMTAWVTFLNLGMSATFFIHWGKAFALAWPFAFCIAVLVGPTAARLARCIDCKFFRTRKP